MLSRKTKLALLELFNKNTSENLFKKNLRELLEKNNIKQTDLAKAIGVDNQTISNWLNDNGSRPKWVDYMYRLNQYLYGKVRNYNPLDLFTNNKLVTDGLEKSTKKKKSKLERLKRLHLEEYIVKLGGANGRLNSAEWKGVDYYTLFIDTKFHELLEDINNNYCKVPISQRVNVHSKGYLEKKLFDYMVNFLEEGNARIEKRQREKSEKDKK